MTALPKSDCDREMDKFVENCDGTTSVKVTGGIIADLVYDYVAASYPDSITEIYTFRKGGSGGTLLATVTIVYTDSTKVDISTAERT